jgi:hypothetical protein
MCLIVDVFNLYVNIVNMVICVTIMVICVMVMVTDNSFVLVIYATEKATLWHTLSTIINKRHIVVELKTIRYNPTCMTQILTIWHLSHMFCQRSMQQNLVSIT